MDSAALAAFAQTRDLRRQTVEALCYAPFSNLYFDRSGDARVCCWNWKLPVGNVRTDSMDDIWRGPVIAELRDRLAASTFAKGCDFCAFQVAEGVFGGARMTQFDRFVADGPNPAWPRQIEFSISNACNLECVMCDGDHSSAIRAHREGRAPMARLYGDAFLASLRPYLPHLEQAKFLGGEPFLATEHFRIWDMMLEDGLATRCHVTTNGTQCNAHVERYLERLPFGFAVSLDAATKATYEAIRVGASFDEVIANSRVFRDYAAVRGTSFSFAFCLMRQNWREFGDLCAMADDWGAAVGVNTVRNPPQFGLYTLADDDLRRVLDGLEMQADEMERRLTRNKRVWLDEVERIRAKVRAAPASGKTTLGIGRRRPRRDAFVFAVAGERHVAALATPLQALKRFSRAEIIVVQARSAVAAAHDQVIQVDVPADYDDHQASILLKTNLLAHVGGRADRFCYLDSDVIAVRDDVDAVFDALDGPVRFAQDHVDIDTFSRWAVRCNCRDTQCPHLREAIACAFGVDVRRCDWRPWNGGVFVFDKSAHDVLATWNRMAVAAFDDPYWKTRDQGVLAAAAWRHGLQDLAPLPDRFNFIIDRMWGVPVAHRDNARIADFHVRGDYALGDAPGRARPSLIHFVNHGVGQRGWRPWDEVAELLAREGAAAPALLEADA